MGRFGSKTDEFERDGLPRSKPRIRIENETDNPVQIPQRKTIEKRTSRIAYEPDETRMHPREFIKRMVLDDDMQSATDMFPVIEKAGYTVSLVTVSNIRAEFKDSLKLLKKLGWRRPKP